MRQTRLNNTDFAKEQGLNVQFALNVPVRGRLDIPIVVPLASPQGDCFTSTVAFTARPHPVLHPHPRPTLTTGPVGLDRLPPGEVRSELEELPRGE